MKTSAVQLDIKGVKQLIRNLDDLPDALRKSAETAVLRAGAVPIRKAAKRFAGNSKDTGLLQKSISLSVKTVRGEKSARVGPRKGMRQMVTRTDKRTGKQFQEKADPSNYSHLVEYGTSHSAAKPFIRPAIDTSKGEVLNAMATGLDTHLTRVAARAARKK
ncbi:HK97 gp10 family phage protein [Luteolibacter yonseiensis]|uniref:HK97 gp10 family phage protein n=1 Tax=Luteolibacter yonseiensis TaxID=1144680 RepID=A0A934VBW0_9BACT|nr:HK97-gp10 family putative phage morphogenesis protein [Luteolibacter yonseiensis]MBK1816530.1 HK97 gp10 family phage protein [Luteolibacter yonseiensis]